MLELLVNSPRNPDSLKVNDRRVIRSGKGSTKGMVQVLRKVGNAVRSYPQLMLLGGEALLSPTSMGRGRINLCRRACWPMR